MLENVIQELIRKQRPYYLLQGNPIKGIDNQYWLVFKHRDADNLLLNIVTFLGISGKHATHKLLRLDPRTAKVFTYTPRFTGSIPSTTLLRTSPLSAIAPFLELEDTTTEETLDLSGNNEKNGWKACYTKPIAIFNEINENAGYVRLSRISCSISRQVFYLQVVSSKFKAIAAADSTCLTN